VSTIGQWLNQTEDLPRREVEILLSEITGMSQARILAFPETPIQPRHQAQLHQASAELRAGTPLAYVLGHQDFWTLRLQVTADVLIPRPETELLVELALELSPRGGSVLDLGTGSGAIAIAVAHSRSDLQVAATDRSVAALEVARANARRYAVDIEFTASDWFERLTGRFNLIVCNPPYIAVNDPHLPELAAEPSTALVSGAEGLDDLARVIAQARNHLTDGGHLAVEHGYDQASEVRRLMYTAGFENIRSVKDLAQIERATIGSHHRR
jgi:release factor glutamine methyltransferase